MIESVMLTLEHTDGSLINLIYEKNSSPVSPFSIDVHWPETDDLYTVANYIYDNRVSTHWVEDPQDPTIRYPLSNIIRMKIRKYNGRQI